MRSFATTARRPRSLREQLEERGKGAKAQRVSQNSRKIEQHGSNPAKALSPSTARPQNTPVANPVSSEIAEKHAPKGTTIADPAAELKFIQEGALAMLDLGVVPEEDDAHVILIRARRLAEALAEKDLDESQVPLQSEDKRNAVPQTLSAEAKNLSALKISLAKTLYTVMEDPKLYITEQLLKTYVHTITTLQLPQYLPKIFHLYAHKPIPKPNSWSAPDEAKGFAPTDASTIKYTQPWSRHPKYAVPLELADLAIESAITARDLPLAITLIDTTVATPQYHIAKFIRRAALPLGSAGLLIPMAWQLSQRAADYQVSWDPDTFFWMCMAGGGAYIGTMGTLLLITVTTWNDHHKRVRWVPGTPLGRRWFREEERYYFDRIAESWGYKDENRHGEESGEEWEALREVCGLRWMEVDRSSLLPGML